MFVHCVGLSVPAYHSMVCLFHKVVLCVFELIMGWSVCFCSNSRKGLQNTIIMNKLVHSSDVAPAAAEAPLHT